MAARQDPRRKRQREEEKVERSIYAHLFAAHPHPRTFPELAREFGDRDAVTRALCSLAEYGIIKFDGGVTESIMPTMTARHCHRLEAL